MNKSLKKYCSHLTSCLLICSIIFFSVTGCDNTQEIEGTKRSQETVDLTTPTEETTIQPTPTEISPQNTTEDVDILENEDIDKMDIKNFRPLQDSFINYDFNVEVNGTKSEPISFLVEGEYDLNQDGQPDKIELLLDGFYKRSGDQEIQTYIEVNGIKQEFYMDYSFNGEVKIINLDKNDEFLEIAYFDEGPSGDPHYVFYRYDGKRLYKIGSIDSGALTNGEGKFLSWFNTSRFEPSFYSAWYEIENDKFVQKSNDITKYLGKNYEFAGGEAFFMPCDEMPKDFSPTWNEMEQFEACELKIIDIFFYPDSRTLNFYFVELENGETGMMYFWIGD
ncbi:hypothetical protein RBH29_17635 [Herbivorax sp. ANBcel31]|uniref:hypothetical protein n=1 Tax=Herbivorax sp. ANBcel31 TaxID=3069754 RepID=UPI0027B71771|nr:hypothetical protein [Herbivorax sp. ANBcel31]MDQ2088249.1 hypothetical protein [Herbivorax sp. ANBcel31]